MRSGMGQDDSQNGSQNRGTISYRSARFRKARSPKPIQDILERVLKRKGLDKKIAQYRFVAHWDEIVGEEIAKRARPDRIQGRCLVVRVQSSVWAQELGFLKGVFLSRLSKYLDSPGLVTDIRFQVG